MTLKHEITHCKPDFLADGIIATALLRKVPSAFAAPDTIIRRREEVFAEVKSNWCCLDASTMRAAWLAQDVIEHFSPRDETPFKR